MPREPRDKSLDSFADFKSDVYTVQKSMTQDTGHISEIPCNSISIVQNSWKMMTRLRFIARTNFRRLVVPSRVSFR